MIGIDKVQIEVMRIDGEQREVMRIDRVQGT